VSFFQDAASELLYPVMPLFITVTLGAPVAALGLIEGVAEGTASILKAVSGRLADRSRRRPLIALGYGISSVAKPLIGLAWAWPVALVGRFVDRVGKGIRTSPRDTALTDGVGKAWVAGLLPAQALGTDLGYYQGIIGGCAVFASVWAGLAWNGKRTHPAADLGRRRRRARCRAAGVRAAARSQIEKLQGGVQGCPGVRRTEAVSLPNRRRNGD